MSEPESQMTERGPVDEAAAGGNRLRRFFLRHVPLGVGGLAVLAALAAGGIFLWMSSEQFEGLVRKRLVAELEQSTGGRVEIASFHWRLLELEADAEGVAIHGREAAGEAPYASAERLRVRIGVENLWSPAVRLRELDIVRPTFHLIVYEDGSTNQPHPRRPRSFSSRDLNTLFDLRAGHVSVEQGIVDYDNRAAAFDFQNRWLPLDFEASDVALADELHCRSGTNAGDLPH